jgi:hypothetical protein
MPHMHWVARQNKLELPNNEEEVNTRDILIEAILLFRKIFSFFFFRNFFLAFDSLSRQDKAGLG